jgi:putative ABC transport system substrate-binding protein
LTQPVVGFLGSTSAVQFASPVAAFQQGLKETGYTDSRNVVIDYRWADGQYERLATLAAELVRIPSNVIVAVAPPAALAAKSATSTIPIVFASGADPVALGLVASINRPGGNITGVNFVTGEITGKILETALELVPQVTTVVFLVNPSNPNTRSQTINAEAAATALRRTLHVMQAQTEAQIAQAFVRAKELGVGAFIVATDVFFLSRTAQLISLSTRYEIPVVYNLAEYVRAGGLLSYGTNLTEAYKQVGRYAGQILNGAKPANLPVMQPTKFELVINLKAAKALGLTVPATLLARADEVIE